MDGIQDQFDNREMLNSAYFNPIIMDYLFHEYTNSLIYEDDDSLRAVNREVFFQLKNIIYTKNNIKGNLFEDYFIELCDTSKIDTNTIIFKKDNTNSINSIYPEGNTGYLNIINLDLYSDPDKVISSFKLLKTTSSLSTLAGKGKGPKNLSTSKNKL